MGKKDIMLKTRDNVSIAGSFFKPDSPNGKGLILLHMFRNNRHSYDEFANEAVSVGFTVMAIDFRGHGDSQGDMAKFSDSDFRSMQSDAEAAKEYLKSNNISRIYVIGASIGANTALNLAASDRSISGAVALSPSKNYHGIDTTASTGKFDKRLFIVSAEGDTQSFGDSVSIYENATGDKFFRRYNNSQHGTNLLDKRLATEILDWLEK